MNPPLSMILFTTVAGAAQGLLLALVGLDWVAVARGTELPPALSLAGAALVLAMSAVGLAAATFHLGHPLRAWRAVAMWRTSWLSREVIVLPLFMAVVFAWAVAHALHAPTAALGAVAALLAIVLYICTGMIYGAVAAIREWATPLTPLNYLVLGIASGLLLAAALAAWAWPEQAPGLARLALAATVLGAATRGYSLWRNLTLAPKTTLQSAIGVRHPRIEQMSQGMMAGTFNTREFMHARDEGTVRRVRWAAALLGFVLPALALAAGAATWPAVALAVLFLLQYAGLLAERWCFFVEARHPQNLYHRRFG
jgi:DMSO reductase anchor subunit